MTDRLSRDEMLMKMAETAALRGTCSRAQVGAVIARDGRVLSMGYNGTPSGLPHCDHSCDCRASTHSHRSEIHDRDCRSLLGCEQAVHAELNAIIFAARHGVRIEGASIYCVYSPCMTCAQAIINSGITQMFYRREYRKTEGIDRMQSAGVSCLQL